jgi:hypothetical protein
VLGPVDQRQSTPEWSANLPYPVMEELPVTR